MSDIPVYFVCEHDVLGVVFKGDEGRKILFDLLRCFGANAVDGKLYFSGGCELTEELFGRVREFVSFLSESEPRYNKLISFLGGVGIGNKLLILDSYPDDTEKSLDIHLALAYANSGSDSAEMRRMVGELVGLYNVRWLDGAKRCHISSASGGARVCRFCGGSRSSGAFFKKVAHAIPEALGNKNIILSDECDACNEFFGNNVEPHLIQYLDFYRAARGIRGKSGAPTIRSGNQSVEFDHSTNMAVVVARKVDTLPDGSLIICTGLNPRYVPIYVYKALCKVALSCMDERLLSMFSDTLRWVRYGGEFPGYNAFVAMTVAPQGMFSLHPGIVIYSLKGDAVDLPCVVVELRIAEILLVYSIPSSCSSSGAGFDEVGFSRLCTVFKHYGACAWKFIDLSGLEKVDEEVVVHVNQSDSVVGES